MKYSSGDFELPKKLAILTVLRNLYDISTRSNLAHYILDLNVMNYFEVQHIIALLVDDECIDAFMHEGREYIKITDKGLSYLEALSSQIPPSWKEPIAKASENALSSREKNNINHIKGNASLKKISDREFFLRLEILDNNSSILDISITVFSEKQANTIVSNWRKDPIKAYENIVQSLTE